MSNFPSNEHYSELRKKGLVGRVNDDDLWAWHAYDYGWRRVMLQTRDDNSPIDSRREWFNAAFAAEAEAFYCRKFNRRPPPISGSDPAPRMPEDLACSTELVRRALACIAEFAARNDRVMRGIRGYAAERQALARVHEALAVRSHEQSAAMENSDAL